MPTTADKTDAMFHAASYHEAGHAVTAIYYGIEVRHIRIHVKPGWLSNPSPDGETWVGPQGDDVDSVTEGIVVSFAGPEAEAWWWQHHYDINIGRARRMHRDHAGGDMQMVSEALDKIDANNRLARRLEAQAQDLVSEVWGSIVDVAEALRDANGFLNAGQVYSLV